jgi:hypothetical protein
LRAALGQDRFGEIRKAVDGFDFQSALERLRAAAQACNLTGGTHT